MQCDTLQLPQATKRVPKMQCMPCGTVRLRTKRALDLSNATSKGTQCLAQDQQIKTTLFLIVSPTLPLILRLTITIHFDHVRDPKMSFRYKIYLRIYLE